MTADDWKKLEAALGFPYGQAELLVDGYKLTLQVRQAKALRFEIVVFVDHWFRGEWLTKDCEERRRFCRPRVSPVHSPAAKAKLAKGFTKRQVAKYFPDLDKTFTWHSHCWSAVGPLKRHLVANNQQIELQDCRP